MPTDELIFAVIAVIISVSSLLYSHYNYRRLKKLLQNDATGRLYAQNNEIRRIFFEKPKYREYFYSNKEITEKDQDYGAVISLAEIILNYLEHLDLQEKNCDEKDWMKWSEMIEVYCKNSPIIRQLILEGKNINSIRVTKSLQKKLKECLEKNNLFAPVILRNIVPKSPASST